MAPVVSLKIIQAIFYLGIIFRRRPFSTYVEARDVSDSWLLSGRIVIKIGNVAYVPSEPLHCFVGVVGGTWPSGAELESLVQEGSSSNWDSSFYIDCDMWR